ncbi:MAG: tetratricopeptide repeat protein, partial [Blastocatellia bacterium]
TVEVVVANRNAAHSFPPEVRDLYEAWVEFEALDAAGRAIYRSGFIKPDGMLDESAHAYRQIILDEQGRQITRHQIWTTTIRAYDNTINAGRSDVARFRFRVPESGRAAAAPSRRAQSAITLRARVNYRRLNQEYASYVLARQRRQMTVPIIRMAQAEVILGTGRRRVTPGGKRTPQWQRWNDYGIGLLEQAQYGQAAAAFRRAAELSPNDPGLFVNAAIAEMRTERFAHHERPQLQKAAELLDRALRIPRAVIADPASLTRARYHRALIWRAEGRAREAADELAQIANEYPRDREVLRQLAQTRYTLGRFVEARHGFEAILRIDPTDFLAHQFLSPLYLSEGRGADAERADKLYLLWRDDPRSDGVAARFFAAHPEWADERIGSHTHGAGASRRPVLTGQSAVPDK